MSEPVTPVEYIKKELPGFFTKVTFTFLGVGIVGVILSFMFDSVRASFNSLIFLMFMTSVGVGSVFLVALEYLTGAVWSTPFRRVSEFLGAIVFLLPLIAIPVYLNLHGIYEIGRAHV